MRAETKSKLLAAWQYCEDNDKSTEFMLEYMQDVANVDLDCVINFIKKLNNESIHSTKQGNKLSKDL